jgi:GTPase SAR1 family protein
MNIKLTEEEHYISFTNSFDDVIYDIRRVDLGDTMDLYDERVSTWVYKLTLKKWATKEMAMRLCEIIKEAFPDNDIDWDETEGYIALMN